MKNILLIITANLLITLLGDDKDRKFDIFADDTLLGAEVWKGGITGNFIIKF